MNDSQIRPEVQLKPSSYRSSKVEMDEEFEFDATSEDVIRAAFQQVKVAEDPDA